MSKGISAADIVEFRESPAAAPEPTLTPPNEPLTGVNGVPAVRGCVVRGDQRGRTLGFPTANLELEAESDRSHRSAAADGVWAGRCILSDGRSIPAAISIGRRSTFYAGSGPRLLEAHLVDFAEDLYGKDVTVLLDHWIRAQSAFSTTEDLIAALERDVEATRARVQRTS